MFVAGLSSASPAEGSSSSAPGGAGPRKRSDTVASTSSLTVDTAGPASRRPSDALRQPESEQRERSGSRSKASPAVSPRNQAIIALPQSPPATDGSGGQEKTLRLPNDESTGGEEVNERDQEFKGLIRDLRGALEQQSGKGKIWLPETERKAFRIMLVDKSVRLPLRKISPSAKASEAPPPGTTPHSPLSPHIPSSPMYPDGLIAPIWIRKHTEFVPCVFVLFLRLYESPQTYDEDKAGETENVSEKAREKEADEALVKEIGERRRRLGERGIKLTVVLMASTETLDSPELDSRLSYIRRSSALASKASLFVLTPVPADQLDEFVQSLQDALYESAIEYYFAHTKRVRRKKGRVNASQVAILGADGKTRGLGGAGWSVRYDWKLGWFAEIRGEVIEARRHYEDCWNELARMFASTTTLPPRTKRWAEAKVLADCLATRICRLFLYDADPQRVLTPFYVHLKRFGDFSRGWGIGDDTFEFWSWVARQYRVLAELLELGLEQGVHIPLGLPPAYPTAAQAGMPPDPTFSATPVSSVNPMFVLQHPAFYYYTAACCSVARKERYESTLAAEEGANANRADRAGVISPAPGFVNEKKVDHAALIVELFSKTYTLLKDRQADVGEDRIALMVAFRIGETYAQSGQAELAMRFFDRISPSFKRDRWTPVLAQIRELWYSCARQVGNVDVAARLLLEKLGGSGLTEDRSQQLQEELLGLLETTKPSNPDPIVIETEAEAGLLSVQFGFWHGTAMSGDVVPFQLVLACPAGLNISSLPITSCEVAFADGRTIVLEHSQTAPTAEVSVGLLDDAQGDHRSPTEANLRWQPGTRKVVNGTATCREATTGECVSVKLFIRQNEWNIESSAALQPLEAWMTPDGLIETIVPPSTTLTALRVPSEIGLDVDHSPSAYVDEILPIRVKLSNTDSRQLCISLSASSQTEEDEQGPLLWLSDETTAGPEQTIDIGSIEAGSSVEKTLHMRSTAEGTAVIELNVRTSAEGAADESAEGQTKMLAIPILRPFRATHTVRTRLGLTAGDGRRENGRAAVVTVLNLVDHGPLVVHDMQLDGGDTERFRLISSTLQYVDKTSFPQTWDETTLYSVSCLFALHQSTILGNPTEPPPPTRLAISWSRSATVSERYTTQLDLPRLTPPARDSFISALQAHPSFVRAHEPFELALTVRNDRPTPAADLVVQVDTSDPFVWLGGRSQVLSSIPSGGVSEVRLKLMPVSGAGWCALPNVRLWEGEGDEREEVTVHLASGGFARGSAVFVEP